MLLESVRNNHRKVCGFFMDENDWTARFVDSMKKLLLELGINDKYIISDNQGRVTVSKLSTKIFRVSLFITSLHLSTRCRDVVHCV